MLGRSRWKLFTMPGHVAIDSKIESNSGAITSNQKASLKIECEAEEDWGR
jgi:hypothetical protein